MLFGGGRYRCIGAGRGSFHGRFLANQGTGGSRLWCFFGFAGGDFVAGLVVQHFRVVVAQALDFEVRGFQVIVRQDDDARTGAQLDLGDGITLFR